jgi:endonuclease G
MKFHWSAYVGARGLGVTRKVGLALGVAALLLSASQAVAIIDASLQMQLGNPTGATVDPTNHTHYLIQRTIEALDYNDSLGVPNWASWDLTASDVGTTERSSTFFTDTSLPAGFHLVTSSEYNSSGWDRGHMCPSKDRSDNTTDNDQTFLMSNIVPQNSSNNSGLWADLENYCRSLTATQEILITCGPRGFGANTIPSGYVHIPSNLWKIAVCVPLGSGTAYDRLTNSPAAAIRVIAIDVPNATPTGSWSNYVISVKQLQDLTGYNFFSALPNNLAWVLRSKVDAEPAAAPSIISFTPSSGPISNSITVTGAALDTITNVAFNGTSAAYTITGTNQLTAVIPIGASSGPITVRGLGGSATSVGSFVLTTPVIPNFTITPAGGFTSTGDQGGPFSPSSQVYTLSNTNGTSMNWAAGKNTSWLDLSASSGTLAAGASTDITVSVNSTADSFLGGEYSDVVTFSNSMTGAWVSRSVNLTVLTPAQLSVSPVNAFNATSQVDGPPSASSQDYRLSNVGSISMNWTANATASWLTLSATSGTLAGGSSTVVTASINSNAISMAQGSYSDTIGFTNTTNGIGNTMRDVNLSIVSFGFYDDFSTFSNGNLVGQSGWQELGITNTMWTFEGDNISAYDGKVDTKSVGNIAADIGSGVATGFHTSAAADWTAPSGNGSWHSWSVNNWTVGDFFQYQISTRGIGGIQLAWDQVSSSTGPRDFVLQWSTNGTTFATIVAYSVNANVSNAVRLAWNGLVYEPADHYTANLSGITAIENQSNVYLRVTDNSTTSAGGGTVGTAGSGRMDNFLVFRAPVTPIQITGGTAWIPAGQTAINPDASKDFQPATNITLFAGLLVNVTNAPVVTSGTPSYFAAFAGDNGGVSDPFDAHYQLTAKAADAANTNYVLGARTTSESGAPFVFGTTALSYGTSYRVIIRTDPAGSNTVVYVNPTSAVLGDQTPYLTAAGGAGITPAITAGSLILTQSKNGSLPTVGAGINRACAGSDYALVHYFLLGVTPPVASFTGVPSSGAAPLNVTFTDTSTGNITNRFWDFGDAVTTNVTTNVVAHTYAAGVYAVRLIVSGPDGDGTNTQPNYITALTPFQVWQIQYFGGTNGAADANADPDGDGQSNLAEFQTGTDPTNSASAFRILSIVPEGNDLRITWSTAPGKTNAAQFAAGSYNTNFVDVFIVTDTVGTITNFLDIGAATNPASGFYRIRLVP